MTENRHRKATLTADGYEPFEQTVKGGGDDASVAQFCAEIWLLGHPERRAAKNIQVTIEDVPLDGTEVVNA